MARRQSVTPTVRLRRLAMDLKELRTRAGMSREQVSDLTAINRVTLYRIETAQTRPQVRTVRALLDVYGVPEPRRTELLTLLKLSHERNWLEMAAADLPRQYATFIGFEQEAERLLTYQSSFIPGLLQTEEYARAAIAGSDPTLPPEEVENRVVVRARRRAERSSPLAIHAVIDEAVLRRQVGGPSVMREQFQHLLDSSREPLITLQVIPFATGAHPGMHGSFVVFQFPETYPDLVYIETSGSALFLDGEADVSRYKLEFRHLCAIAASPEKTNEFLADMLADTT